MEHRASASHANAILTAAPVAAPVGPEPAGEQPLGLGGERDGVVVVPDGYAPDRPAPLLVALHGAGGSGRRSAAPLREAAGELGILVLAPDSRGRTWDVILGGYGPDVAFIDAALEHVFGRFAVDPARVALEGFSDGASYALSLGIANGGLVSDLIAFSPGFVIPAVQRGAPRMFVSHGRQDPVLPIDHCSRHLVPQLEQAGYDVRYVEFEGGHGVPPDIAREALERFATG